MQNFSLVNSTASNFCTTGTVAISKLGAFCSKLYTSSFSVLLLLDDKVSVALEEGDGDPALAVARESYRDPESRANYTVVASPTGCHLSNPYVH